jgi:ubiquinone/menaquinone biosynthesis C-methylase UbiE
MAGPVLRVSKSQKSFSPLPFLTDNPPFTSLLVRQSLASLFREIDDMRAHDARISSLLSEFERRLEEQAELAREVERLKGFV